MPNRLVMSPVPLSLLGVVLVGVACAPLGAQETGRRADALAAVAEVMALRRGALGDSLPFDACTIFEQAGRPSGFPAGIPPGLIPLLDRTGPDPCATKAPGDGDRLQRTVRVDSVTVTDSAAFVHLSIRRGEWSYNEEYTFASLPQGRGWGFREARMTHPFRVMPAPGTIRLDGRRNGADARLPLTFVNGERVLIDSTGRATPPAGVRLIVRIPDDIEWIEVLPRDTAVERYGPEGAAGAVLITTRSGRVP
jgi:hypothetical protein